MLNSWDVRPSRQSERQLTRKRQCNDRLLTEAYDEFELEERETAEVPVSVYVERYPEDVKEETVMEETIEANTTEEKTAKEGLYYEETGEVTVSALSSPYLSMLRDCKCLVRCQVSVCLSQVPWLKSGGTRARLSEFRITPSDQAIRSVRPASAESTSSSMQTSFTGALTPNTFSCLEIEVVSLIHISTAMRTAFAQ